MAGIDNNNFSIKEEFANFPHVGNDAIMIYTLRESVLKHMFMNENELGIGLLFKQLKAVEDRVFAQMKHINNLSAEKVKEIFRAFGLKTTPNMSDDEYRKAVLDYVNGRIDTVTSQTAQDYRKAVNAVTDIRKTHNSRKVIVSNSAFKSIENQLLQAQNLTNEEIDKFICNTVNQQIQNVLAQSIGNLNIVINLEQYKNSKNVKNNTERLIKNMQKVSKSKYKEIVAKYMNTLKTEVRAKAGEILKKNIDLIVKEYGNLLIKMVDIAIQNSISVSDLLELKKFLTRITNNDMRALQKLGYLYEGAATLQLKEAFAGANGNTVTIEHKDASKNEETDVTDILMTFNNVKIKISNKSNNKPVSVFKKIVTPEVGTFIDKDVKEMIGGKNELVNTGMLFACLNIFALEVRGRSDVKNKMQDNFANLVGRLRSQYGRLLAMKYILGSVFSQYDIKIEKTPSLLTNYEEFPVFLQTPQGMCLTTDVISDMIENIGGKDTPFNNSFYKKDLGLQTALNKTGTMDDFVRLLDLGYSYPALRRYNMVRQDYVDNHKVYNIPNVDLTNHELRYKSPYFSEDLEEALEIMRSITDYFKTGDNLFNVLIDGINVYCQNYMERLKL